MYHVFQVVILWIHKDGSIYIHIYTYYIYIMSLNFDINKFTYYDSSILKELYDEARATPAGGLDDFLKLPVNPSYK